MPYIPKQMVQGFKTRVVMPQSGFTLAAGYSAQIVLAGTTTQTFNGLNTGTDWVFEIQPTAGLYQATIVVLDSSNARILIETARVEVLADPTAIAAGSDIRTDAEKMVAAITATLKNKATADQQSLTINGRQITRYSISELTDLLRYYKSEVSKQKKKAPKAVVYRFGRG